MLGTIYNEQRHISDFLFGLGKVFPLTSMTSPICQNFTVELDQTAGTSEDPHLAAQAQTGYNDVLETKQLEARGSACQWPAPSQLLLLLLHVVVHLVGVNLFIFLLIMMIFVDEPVVGYDQ